MAFRVLLHALGVLFSVASRVSDRFRAQITRRVVIELRSEDGVAHHFTFSDRAAYGTAGRAEKADAAIVFATAWQGFTTLTSPSGTKHLVDGLLDETVRFEGNVPLLLWFQGLAGMVAPIESAPHLPATPPEGYVAHAASPEVSRRITREPPADELDPTWTAAHEARAKLNMIRHAKGEPLKPF